MSLSFQPGECMNHLMQCATQYRWYAMLSDSRYLSVWLCLAFSSHCLHLYAEVYVHFLWFFFLLSLPFRKCHPFIVARFIPPKWKMCTVFSFSFNSFLTIFLLKLFIWQQSIKYSEMFSNVVAVIGSSCETSNQNALDADKQYGDKTFNRFKFV